MHIMMNYFFMDLPDWSVVMDFAMNDGADVMAHNRLMVYDGLVMDDLFVADNWLMVRSWLVVSCRVDSVPHHWVNVLMLGQRRFSVQLLVELLLSCLNMLPLELVLLLHFQLSNALIGCLQVPLNSVLSLELRALVLELLDQQMLVFLFVRSELVVVSIVMGLHGVLFVLQIVLDLALMVVVGSVCFVAIDLSNGNIVVSRLPVGFDISVVSVMPRGCVVRLGLVMQGRSVMEFGHTVMVNRRVNCMVLLDEVRNGVVLGCVDIVKVLVLFMVSLRHIVMDDVGLHVSDLVANNMRLDVRLYRDRVVVLLMDRSEDEWLADDLIVGLSLMGSLMVRGGGP